MSAGDGRLNRLHAGLTARERVLLEARAQLAGERPDPALRYTMPAGQTAELNQLVALFNGTLHVLVPTALQIEAEVAGLSVLVALRDTIVAWGSDRAQLVADLSLLAHIPIAESEYRARLERTRQQYLPLRDAAGWVAELRDISTAQAVRDLRAVAATISRRRGRTIEFEVGALCEWLGIAVPCRPEWGTYQVVPDAELAQHAAQLAAVARLTHPAAPAPPGPLAVQPVRGVSDVRAQASDEALGPWGGALRTLTERIRADLPRLWGRLLAVELVTAEVASRFQDSSVIPERLDALLSEVREELRSLAERASATVGTVELPPPRADFADVLRRAMRPEETTY